MCEIYANLESGDANQWMKMLKMVGADKADEVLEKQVHLGTDLKKLDLQKEKLELIQMEINKIKKRKRTVDQLEENDKIQLEHN